MPGPEIRPRVRLGGTNVLGGGTLGALLHVELYRLAFVDSAEALHFDVGLVTEQILPSIIGSDESVTFGFIEPFYFSNHYKPFGLENHPRAG